MQIYKLISPSNKIYIGKTKYEFPLRWKQHTTLYKKETKTKNYSLPKLYHAFDKYPIDQWKHEIILECETIEELNKSEIFYIEYYDSIKNGYNLTKGGDGRAVDFLEEQHKDNISKARLEYFQTEAGILWKKELSTKYFGENNPMYGKTQSEKQKLAVSLANKGKIVSEETREKMRINASHTILTDERKENLGIAIKKAHADGRYDYKAMAEMRKGFKQPQSQKDKTAIKLQKEFDFNNPQGNHVHVINLQKFCRDNNLDQGNMTKVHNGKLKTNKGWTKFV